MFKPGDRVVCIDSTCMGQYLTKGARYTVKEYFVSHHGHGPLDTVALKEVSELCFADRFELVVDLALKFPFQDDHSAYGMDISTNADTTTDVAEQAICGAMLEVGREIGALERKVDRAQFLQKSAEGRVDQLICQREAWNTVAARQLKVIAQLEQEIMETKFGGQARTSTLLQKLPHLPPGSDGVRYCSPMMPCSQDKCFKSGERACGCNCHDEITHLQVIDGIPVESFTASEAKEAIEAGVPGMVEACHNGRCCR